MTKKLLGPIFALAVGALVGAANAPAVQADADSFTYTTDDSNGGAERPGGWPPSVAAVRQGSGRSDSAQRRRSRREVP